MKKLGLLPLLLLAGCQSTPSFCEKEPGASLCDQSTYKNGTVQALKEFERRKAKKAFALGQAEDGSEFFGYSEGYDSIYKARARALDECQKRMDRHAGNGKCELIR